MAVVSLTVYCGIRIQRTISAVPNVPELKDTYWGPGEYVKDSPDIKPFKISFPESVSTSRYYNESNTEATNKQRVSNVCSFCKHVYTVC